MIYHMEERVINTNGHVAVAGDFNARDGEWKMPSTNSWGKYILDLVARAGLTCCPKLMQQPTRFGALGR